jgi:hypothetical protein
MASFNVRWEAPPFGPSTFDSIGNGYMARTSGVEPLWGALQLPNGAVIDSVTLFVRDDDPNFNGGVFLLRYQSEPEASEVLGSAQTGGTPGITSVTFSPGARIDNSRNAYVLLVDMGPSEMVSTRAVRVRWRREVSPPPLTATFSDVTSNHPLFRYVEAIARAGIAGGCGGGAFCPDASLTRGQMAVFLAVALGLYWPN